MDTRRALVGRKKGTHVVAGKELAVAKKGRNLLQLGRRVFQIVRLVLIEHFHVISVL